MRIRIPKALLGWRKFFADLWTIVLGVLIALTAEQYLETRKWQEQVGDFRQALRVEMAENMGSYQFRRAQDRCVEFRIAELEAWLRSHRAGRPISFTGPIGIPASLSLGSSVWASRTSELQSHMPLGERLNYAKIYDEAANNEAHRLAERDAWIELADFNGSAELGRSELMRLQGLINQVRYRHDRFEINSNAQLGYAKTLRLQPKWATTWISVPEDQCRSVLPTP